MANTNKSQAKKTNFTTSCVIINNEKFNKSCYEIKAERMRFKFLQRRAAARLFKKNLPLNSPVLLLMGLRDYRTKRFRIKK